MEKREVFIQANDKQLLGAKVAKYAMETRGGAKEAGIPVTIMHVENMSEYMKYVGMTYKRGDKVHTHDPNDLQFFTLSRFFPPHIMNYEGQALVIDPDIFALQSVIPLFKEYTAPIAACTKKGAWDSSVMVLTNKNLTHWDPKKLLTSLKDRSTNYTDIMTLKNESVHEIPRTNNNLDTLTNDTVLLHTTNRLTQPWRTGLPIDFVRSTPPRLFGFIPRIPILKLRGLWPDTYQRHPNKDIEKLTMNLFKEAYEAGALTDQEIQHALKTSDIRKDIYEFLI